MKYKRNLIALAIVGLLIPVVPGCGEPEMGKQESALGIGNGVSTKCVGTIWKLGPMGCKNACRKGKNKNPAECTASDCQLWGIRKFAAGGKLQSFFMTISEKAKTGTVITPLVEGAWKVDSANQLSMRSRGKSGLSHVKAQCNVNGLVLNATKYKAVSALKKAALGSKGILKAGSKIQL